MKTRVKLFLGMMVLLIALPATQVRAMFNDPYRDYQAREREQGSQIDPKYIRLGVNLTIDIIVILGILWYQRRQLKKNLEQRPTILTTWESLSPFGRLRRRMRRTLDPTKSLEGTRLPERQQKELREIVELSKTVGNKAELPRLLLEGSSEDGMVDVARAMAYETSAGFGFMHVTAEKFAALETTEEKVLEVQKLLTYCEKYNLPTVILLEDLDAFFASDTDGENPVIEKLLEHLQQPSRYTLVVASTSDASRLDSRIVEHFTHRVSVKEGSLSAFAGPMTDLRKQLEDGGEEAVGEGEPALS